MEELLKKLGLKIEFTTELKANKNDFATAFYYNVDEGRTGGFSGMFDIFSSGKNEYRGIVNPDHFKVQRKRRMFDMNGSFAIATGDFYQRGDTLVIETKIKGFNPMFVPFLVIGGVVYSIFIIAIFTVKDFPIFVLPFILFHACLMFGIPLFIMKRSVKKLKYELDRDFFFWTKTFPDRK